MDQILIVYKAKKYLKVAVVLTYIYINWRGVLPFLRRRADAFSSPVPESWSWSALIRRDGVPLRSEVMPHNLCGGIISFLYSSLIWPLRRRKFRKFLTKFFSRMENVRNFTRNSTRRLKLSYGKCFQKKYIRFIKCYYKFSDDLIF